jgi:hypothetical protein
VTTVVGAVPNVMPVVAVPPEILRLDPDVLRADENHSVVNTNVDVVDRFTVTCTKFVV